MEVRFFRSVSLEHTKKMIGRDGFYLSLTSGSEQVVLGLYSAQYLHILQDSKSYLNDLTEQSTVQALK